MGDRIILESHRAAFFKVAKRLKAAIIVRQTNEASLVHIGKPYAVPKRIDCKPKTADYAITAPNGAQKKVAGLVVCPRVAGAEAYGRDKRNKVDALRTEFEPMLSSALASAEDLARLTYVPGGKQYFVEHRQSDPYFGCIKFTATGLISAGKVIHGDYDLYGIVPLDDPSRNERATYSLAGQTHAKGRLFMDAQIWLNTEIGLPMILHGSQEKYASEHSDDVVGVYDPSGRERIFRGKEQISLLYATEFRGRKLFPQGRFEADLPYHAA